MTFRRPLLMIAALCAAFALALFVDLHPALRGGFGWRWPYVLAPLTRVALLALMVAVYIGVGYGLVYRVRRDALTVGWAFLGSMTLALVVIALRHDDIGFALFTRTASMVATGPHHTAANLDMNLDTLRTWTERMAAFDPETETISRHVLLAPPGIPLFYEGLNTLLGNLPALAARLQLPLILYQCRNYALLAYTPAEWSSAWFGMLMPLWAAFTVFPLYGSARRLGLPAGAVVIWWPLVPGIASFSGSWNTLYPLLILTAFWLLLVGLQRERGALWWIGCGVFYGISIFLNFAPVPAGLIIALFTILTSIRERGGGPGWWRSVRVGLWVLLGTLLPWAVWMSFGGASPLAILRASFGIHLDLERAYLPWIFLHLYDWALFAGLPLVIISLWATFRNDRSPGSLPAALWISLLILLISGTARAETARVWTFFSPFALLAAAVMVKSARDWLALTVATAFMFIALTSTWDVFDAIDMPPPPPAPGPVNASIPARFPFDDAFTLAAWDATASEDEIHLRLDWRVDERSTTPYWFSALLVAPDGSTAPEATLWQGRQTNYPTTCWRPGEMVGDEVTIPLPENAAAGDYWLSLSVFAEQTPDQRLPVTLPDGTTDSQVGLGPVQVTR